MPELVDGLRRLAHALLADLAGVPPLQREVLQQQDPEARRRPGTARGPAMWAWDPQHRRAPPRRPARRRAGRRRRWRRPGPGGSAGCSSALEEQPLTVDRADPVVPGHLPQPGATRPTVAERSPRHEHLDADLGQAADHRAPRGHHRRGRSRSSDQSISFVPAAQRVLGHDATTSPWSDVRTRTARAAWLASGAASAGGPGCRRASGTTRAAPVELAPDRSRRRRRAARRPRAPVPGPRASQCWNRPVMLRPPAVPGPRCGAQVTSTASTWSSPSREQAGDVEAVREEVALGVAEVRAVEPDVGLVEDPVERDPATSSGGGSGHVEPSPEQDRPVAGGELGAAVPVTRDRGRSGHRRVVDVEPDAVVAELVVSSTGTPRSREVDRHQADSIDQP